MSPTSTLRQQITGDEPPVPNHSDDPDIEPPEEAMNDDDKTEQAEETYAEEQARTHSDWRTILQAPTPPTEVQQRTLLRAGGVPVTKANGEPLMLDYVTARFVQDRLDSAVGPDNWQVTFENLPNGAVRASIGLRVPDADDWVWKSDVGVPSMIEPDKGAHSDAFKRAGVMWGIARDLYDARADETLQAATAAQPIMPQPQQVMPQPQVPPGMPAYTADPQPQVMQQPGAGWMCPLHNDVKVVPAGTSKKTGKPYNAFYACPVPGCDQTGPRAA